MARYWHLPLIMSKTRKPSRRTRRNHKTESRTVDVISQLECATRHPRAAILGGLLGGAVPWFARELAHGEIPQAWSGGHQAIAGLMVAVVLGCACFSMLTVYKFGRAAFDDERKALGFVLALEGVMLVSHGTTSLVALLLLVAINAIANGCVIALSREATARRQDADARRSATRAKNRARTHGGAPVATAPISAPAPVSAPTSGVRTRRPAAPAPAPALVTRPRWAPEVVEDAEIVSEERYAYS